MKRLFFTGLVILLPIALTLMIVMFLVNILTRPFEGAVDQLLVYYQFKLGYYPLKLLAKALILTFLFLCLFLVGVLTRWITAKYFMRFFHRVILQIPIVNKIYQACQDVVRTLLGPEEHDQYTHVVLVPFHSDESRCIGFVTNKTRKEGQEFYSVFVPATPNPTMGFMLLIPSEKITFLDMTIEEALTTVISCGVLSGTFSEKS